MCGGNDYRETPFLCVLTEEDSTAQRRTAVVQTPCSSSNANELAGNVVQCELDHHVRNSQKANTLSFFGLYQTYQTSSKSPLAGRPDHRNQTFGVACLGCDGDSVVTETGGYVQYVSHAETGFGITQPMQ